MGVSGWIGVSGGWERAGRKLPAHPPVPSLVQKVMEAMGVLAIVVNCYLIAQCGQLQRLFPWLSPEGAIISVVVLEVRRSLCYRRVSRCAALSGPRFPTPPPRGVHFGEGDAQRAPPVSPQHFALLLKYVIQVAIPDIPAWVAEEMAKLEYQRREAFKVGDANGVKGGG